MNERKQYISLIREIAIALVLLTYPFMFIHAMSYESTFAVFAIVGIIARRYCVKNDLRIDSKAKVLYVLLAALISGMFIIADYSLFIDGTKLSLLKIPVAFIDGFIAFAGIFLSAYDILLNAKYVEHKKDKKFPFLLAAFLAPVIVDNIYLRFCAYPGWLDNDAANQFYQMINKSYTNHHPFWHTKWMEMIVKPVYEMTGEGNIAIYVFGIFQIMIMSIVFVYAVDTIWEMGLSKKWIVAIIIGYSLSPYNVGISVGILKDAAFSIALSLMLVALVRLINDCGKYRYIDFILLATGVLGSCLFRTNGMIVVMVTVPFTWILFAKEKKSIPITITTVFVFAFLLNKIYMNVNDIPQPDTVESLSIPLQQIARTSMDQKEISEQAKEYLDIVVGYDKLAEAYVSDISDSVKNIIRNEGNQQYLTDHKLEFIKVWIDIGIHHPFNYLKGWVDQTRGYWGPSYCFWGGLKGIVIETNGFMNFHKVSNDNIVRHIWDMWEKLLITDFIPGFEIIFSQGIRLWILVFCLIYSFFHNRKNTIVCLIPIAVVFTLVIATPVCYEFRYAYPIYEMFMLVVLATLRCNRVNNNT